MKHQQFPTVTMPSSPSTRWCPTPEQLMILEELYRNGLRSPNSFHIQKITELLSSYGRIQGKSVFYWFQNHKARDRQKLRKKLAKQLHQPHFIPPHPAYPNIHQFMQTPLTDSLQSHAPSGFRHFSFSYTGGNLHPQVAASLPKEFPDMSWISDLTKDSVTKPAYVHDVEAMATNMGSSFTCCRKRPLETLQLFPLISPHVTNQETAS